MSEEIATDETNQEKIVDLTMGLRDILLAINPDEVRELKPGEQNP